MRIEDVNLELKREPDGRRYVRPYLGLHRVTGVAKRPYRSFPDGLTDDECLAEAREWLAMVLDAGSLPLADALTLYVDAQERRAITGNTVKTYRYLIRRLGNLGKARVADVRPRDISQLYDRLIDEGMSRRSVLLAHNFLSAAWKYFADELEAVEVNVMAAVAGPKPGQHDAKYLDDDDYETMRRLIAKRLGPDVGLFRRCTLTASLLAVAVGLREGEACALRRRDVNFANGNLCIHAIIDESSGKPVYRQGTKGKRTRNVLLPEYALADLREWFAWQDEAICSTNRRTPIVSYTGEFIRPSAISRDFKAIAREEGFEEGVTFHSLRHTHATYAIADGVGLKDMQQRLGHANAATTLNIYSHAVPDGDRAAADSFDRRWGDIE